MNETLVPVLVALIAVVADRVFGEVLRSRADSRNRKSLLSALRAEVETTVYGLRELLEISGKSGHANIVEFLRLAGDQASAGSVFLGVLPNLGLIGARLVQELAGAYMRVRVAAHMAEALGVKRGVDMITSGEVDRVRQEVRAALAAFQRVEAELARSVK